MGPQRVRASFTRRRRIVEPADGCLANGGGARMNFLGCFGQQSGFSFGEERKNKKARKSDQRGQSRVKTALMYVLGSTAFAITILVKFAETAG